MSSKDPRVDDYIDGAPDFARPILTEIRKRIHAACPDAVETLKWGAPHFTYRDKLYAGMSSFKRHCAFGFWHPLMRPSDKSLEGMGMFGRITSVNDLPGVRQFARLAKQAMQLTDDGVKPPRPKTKPRPVVVPPVLAAALKRNARARATFDAFSASHRREYADWIAEAKTEETRERRLAQALEWLAQGKARHWKYQA